MHWLLKKVRLVKLRKLSINVKRQKLLQNVRLMKLKMLSVFDKKLRRKQKDRKQLKPMRSLELPRKMLNVNVWKQRKLREF